MTLRTFLNRLLRHAYFTKLENTPYKRMGDIGEGTPTILMEKNRVQLFREVQAFLDEPNAIESH